MSSYWFQTILYEAILLIAVIASLIQYSKLDKASKCIASLILLAFITETIATWAAYKYHQNNIIYNIHGPLNLLLIGIYFNRSIKSFQEKKVGVIIGILGFIIAAINIIPNKTFFTFNNNFLAIKSLVVVFMCLYYYYDFLKKDTYKKELPIHFWFTSLLLVYWSFTLLQWLIGMSKVNAYTELSLLAYYIIFGINLITYLAFALLLFNYNKFQRSGK